MVGPAPARPGRPRPPSARRSGPGPGSDSAGSRPAPRGPRATGRTPTRKGDLPRNQALPAGEGRARRPNNRSKVERRQGRRRRPPRVLPPSWGRRRSRAVARRRAVFVLRAVPQRRHGQPEAVPAQVGPVPLAVAARAAAAGEGGGALQKLQLSGGEERG